MTYLKNRKYKGFTIRLWKDVWNQITPEIKKKRYEGTQRQEYFSKSLDSEKTVLDAFRSAKKYIDSLKNVEWESSGLKGASYLPE